MSAFFLLESLHSWFGVEGSLVPRLSPQESLGTRLGGGGVRVGGGGGQVLLHINTL